MKEWEQSYRCWLTSLAVGLQFVLALTIGGAAAETARVAVLDFSVTESAGGSGQWAWARGGLADVLQIQLQQQGLVLLDRDLIHAVLNEQRVAANGLTSTDQLTLSRLLNAQYLISGRVIPLEGERFRVEVGTFSVEAIEAVVATASEGRFPIELSSVMETVARQISSGLKARVAFSPAPQRTGPAPKPESLIMFYRGLNACAWGQPARAAAYFMNAAALDSEFTVPLLWEIKAYEMAGLADHAALRREEMAEVLKPLGFAAAGSFATPARPTKRVVAVLFPLVTGANSSIEASSLGVQLTQLLLEMDQVRVFASEGISAAVAEQDLKLSSLFDRQYAPRYGRWLASDGLLLCRVNAADTNQIALELSLADPATASVGVRVKRVGAPADLTVLLRSAAVELLDQWTNSPTPFGQSVTDRGTPADSTDVVVTDLRPVYRGLVAALVGVQREPRNSGAHSALADAFASTGRLRLAALEIERCLENLDIHASRADKTYLGVHRWLFWSAQPARGAVGFVNPRAIDRLIEQLLTTYPDSFAAGCLHYNLAVSDWMGKNWAAAAGHATAARKSIRPPEKDADFDGELFAATFFLEGDSLARLGRTNDARGVFTQGLNYMSAKNVRDFCLPYGPWIGDFFGTEKVLGYGGDRPGIRTRIEQALASLNGTSSLPESTALANEPTTAAASEPENPAVAWIKRADAHLQSGRYTDALRAYETALTEKASLADCAGLRTALAELALERNRDRALDEVERCRVEFGLPPVAISWVEWFSAGRKYQTSRAFDLEKAVAAYRATLDFLEHPERGGFYRLESERGSDRVALRWGASNGELDGSWSEQYGARWNNAAFHLAQCLIEIGRREEAAQWLRRIALGVGGDDMPLFKQVSWFEASYNTVKLGVLAADLLKELHASLDEPKFGEADGPYKIPVARPQAQPPTRPLPAIKPVVAQALTNILLAAGRETNQSRRDARLQSFIEQYGRETIPAVLTQLSPGAEARDEAALLWLLDQSATNADAPWVVAACRTNWQLIALAQRLDAAATGSALAEEWRSYSAQDFVPPDLIHQILRARVRPMYALVLKQISGRWINHHMVVSLMDRVVVQEKSDVLEAAFREALARCLKLKLQEHDQYELSRISQIALRHGVPEAIEGVVVGEGASPDKLRKILGPFLKLPPGDDETLAYLRSNRSRWEWDSDLRQFKPMPDGRP